jgi:hypothetical protein
VPDFDPGDVCDRVERTRGVGADDNAEIARPHAGVLKVARMGLDAAGRQQTAQGQHQSLSEHWSK